MAYFHNNDKLSDSYANVSGGPKRTGTANFSVGGADISRRETVGQRRPASCPARACAAPTGRRCDTPLLSTDVRTARPSLWGLRPGRHKPGHGGLATSPAFLIELLEPRRRFPTRLDPTGSQGQFSLSLGERGDFF